MELRTFIAPVMRHYRAKRMAFFEKVFTPQGSSAVIDVGGTPDNWRLISAKPHVVLLNIRIDNHEEEGFTKVEGDARSLPYEDRTFDIAFSNSVIEHVGSWQDQLAFARELRRVGKSYYMQTPNKHFPVEPHVLGLFVQYLPRRAARKALRYLTPHAWIHRPSQEWVDDFVDSTRLLTEREIRLLFPEATIVREKAFGLTKSIIAYYAPSRG